MKREIEFRAKHYKTNKWLYGLPRRWKHSETLDKFTITDYEGNEIAIDEKTLGQFTGMYDSNGNKIFEGDILKVVDVFSAAKTSFVGFVDFRRGMWCVVFYFKPLQMWVDRALYNHSSDGKNATVIGNMTDTSELVNQLNS